MKKSRKETRKPLSEQTIVITGASSGIGLATAYAAAEKGAKLVLAARNEEALIQAVDRIREGGGQAVYVVADVSDPEDIQQIASKALSEYGGFDTWVNDAGSGIFGRIEDITDEDNRRLFDINFWSIVYGSLIALEHLKKKGGAIINLGSQASDTAVPMLGMYSATKHAIKGFTDALRMEVEAEGYPVSLTLIKPAAIGTPFFEHAKSYTQEAPKVPSGAYRPEEVAKAILYAAECGPRDLDVGGQAKVTNFICGILPRLGDKLNKSQIKSLFGKDRHLQEGTLFEAGNDGHLYGHGEKRLKASLYTRARIRPVRTFISGLVLAMLAFGGAAAFRKKPFFSRVL